MKLNIKANGLENKLDTDKAGVAYACGHRKVWRAVNNQINQTSITKYA